MSDQEIIETVMPEREDSDSEDEDPSPPPTVTHSQAFEAFECALQQLQSKGDTDPAHLLLVKNWRDLAAQHRALSLNQSKITSYLKKKKTT